MIRGDRALPLVPSSSGCNYGGGFMRRRKSWKCGEARQGAIGRCRHTRPALSATVYSRICGYGPRSWAANNPHRRLNGSCAGPVPRVSGRIVGHPKSAAKRCLNLVGPAGRSCTRISGAGADVLIGPLAPGTLDEKRVARKASLRFAVLRVPVMAGLLIPL